MKRLKLLLVLGCAFTSLAFLSNSKSNEIEISKKKEEQKKLFKAQAEPKKQDLSQREQSLKKLKRSQNKNIVLTELSRPDGHIKQAALQKIKNYKINDTVIKALVKHVLNYHNPKLISQLFAEFDKINDERLISELNQKILAQLKGGAVITRQKIAENVPVRFIAASKDAYQNYAQTLPKYSKVRLILNAKLNTQSL